MTPASRVSRARRTGQFLTGLGALVILVGLLFGAPIALITVAGNPLPDHLPTLDEVVTALTSRDDGQLFLRALAIVGWAGWATFALSVLLELPARALRRPAPRLPGMSRQQRAAAALLGSVALMVVAGPAAAASAATASGASTVATAPVAPGTRTEADWLLAPPTITRQSAPVYRVEKGDYLGHIADRYLGDFDRYGELAKLNKIRNPNRIRPGALLHLPEGAEDRGARKHATGLVATPPPPGGREKAEPAPPAPTAPSAQPAPDATTTSPPDPSDTTGSDDVTYAAGASQVAQVNQLNRPLAVSAVIAFAGAVGAQVGAALGLRRRPPSS